MDAGHVVRNWCYLEQFHLHACVQILILYSASTMKTGQQGSSNDFEFRGRTHIKHFLGGSGGMLLTVGRPGNEASYYPCCDRSRSWTELVRVISEFVKVQGHTRIISDWLWQVSSVMPLVIDFLQTPICMFDSLYDGPGKRVNS